MKYVLTLLFLLLASISHAGIYAISPNGVTTPIPSLTAAATRADLAGRDIVVSSPLSSSFSNISSATVHGWPTDRRLRIDPGGSIGNTTTFRFLGSQLVAGIHQIFTGSGRVLLPSSIQDYPEWWGVTGTNDDVAVQAAVNAYGDDTKIRVINTVLTGTYNLAHSVRLHHKTGNLIGLGFGDTNGAPYSVLNWTGGGGTPVLNIDECQGLHVRGFRFRNANPSSNIANIPSAIGMHIVGIDPVGPQLQNAYNVFEDIWIGNYMGLEGQPGSVTDYQFVNGIYFYGDNTGNNYNTFRNIRMWLCYNGVNIDGTQYGQNEFDGLWVSFAYNGISTTAATVGSNWFFDNNGTDLHISNADSHGNIGTALLTVHEFSSEGSAQMAKIASGGALSIIGGSFQTTAGKFSGTVVDGTGAEAVNVTLNDFWLYGGGWVGTPLFSIRPAVNTASMVGRFKADNVHGLTLSMLDMATSNNADDRRYIDVVQHGTYGSAADSLIVHNTLIGVAGVPQAVDSTTYDIQGTMNLRTAPAAYASNAAAIAAGLTAGKVYRQGDFLAVVH